MIELCELVWVTVIGTTIIGTTVIGTTVIGTTAIGTTGGTGTGSFELTIVIISSFIAIVVIVVFVTSFVVLFIIYSKKLSSKFTPAEAIYDLPGEREQEPFQMTPSDAYGKTITKEPYIMSTCSAYEL